MAACLQEIAGTDMQDTDAPASQRLCLGSGAWARQNAQSGNPAVRKLAAQKRVEGCEAMLEQAKQDLEKAGQRARMVTKEQPATARVRLSDHNVP